MNKDFAEAKAQQMEPTEAHKAEVVEKGFGMVLRDLEAAEVMPEFAEFASLEIAREHDPLADLSNIRQWMKNVTDLPSCCLGHRTEELANIGKMMLVTAIACESGGCDDDNTHKFLRYVARSIQSAIDYMALELLPITARN